MPTYEYECQSCGHRFEAFQNMSDDPIERCPECGKKVRRLIGGGLGVIFKGSGFYVTDNRGSSGGGADRHAPKSSNGDSSSGDGASKGSSESKNGNGSSGGEKKSGSKGSGTTAKEPA